MSFNFQYNIDFVETKKPITEYITKFGGQPVWINENIWPINSKTGNPMMFICQIVLYPELFECTEFKMAYVFMTDEPDVNGIQTWDSDGGDNAVIIQSGVKLLSTENVLLYGPSIYKKIHGKKDDIEPCEFYAKLSKTEVKEIIYGSNDISLEHDGNKIGGNPLFLQYEEFPYPGKEEWRLLLQLDSVDIPFYLDFGDAGLGYVFVNRDCTKAKFLWQCY